MVLFVGGFMTFYVAIEKALGMEVASMATIGLAVATFGSVLIAERP